MYDDDDFVMVVIAIEVGVVGGEWDRRDCMSKLSWSSSSSSWLSSCHHHFLKLSVSYYILIFFTSINHHHHRNRHHINHHHQTRNSSGICGSSSSTVLSCCPPSSWASTGERGREDDYDDGDEDGDEDEDEDEDDDGMHVLCVLSIYQMQERYYTQSFVDFYHHPSHLSIHSSNLSNTLSIHLSHPSIYLSIHLPIHLIHLSIHPSIHFTHLCHPSISPISSIPSIHPHTGLCLSRWWSCTTCWTSGLPPPLCRRCSCWTEGSWTPRWV